MDGYNMKFETGKGLEKMKNYDWKDPEEKGLADYGKKAKKAIRNLQLY